MVAVDEGGVGHSNPLSGTSVLPIHTYNEEVERRSYLRLWCDIEQFQTDSENAVFLAVRANSLRQKVRMMRDGKRRDEMLAIVQSALPTDAPAIAHELRDGLAEFRDRVSDRIWNEHRNTLQIARCDECNNILKSPQAQQCLGVAMIGMPPKRDGPCPTTWFLR